MLKDSCEKLGVSLPLITVKQYLVNDYDKLFQRYNFMVQDVKCDVNDTRVNEYAFNGGF